MIELSIIERFIYNLLLGTTPLDGFRIAIAPFDIWKNQGDNTDNKPLPIVYFQHLTSIDRNAIGPGKRLLTSATYEIGIFHDANSYAATFTNRTGATVTLLAMLDALETAFNDFSPDMNQPTGYVYSCQRESPIRMSERGPDGVIYKRDGGIYKFNVRKA